MAQIYQSIIGLVGHTPLVRLTQIERRCGLQARLLAKVESFNPGGSVKDRVALAMIEAAEANGQLRAGGIIVEPTSGNTGVGLAWVAAVKGYRAIFTMPDTMSLERRRLLQAYGAELVLTPGGQGMAGAIARAEQLVRELPDAFMPLQFSNRANPMAHQQHTAVEIWEDTDGEVDVLVAGVGTGGTLCGTAAGLKARKPGVLAVAVEPDTSAVLSGGRAGAHKLQGIGAGFVPENYDARVVDEVMPVSAADAFAATRMLTCEGLLVGISSGAALHAAIQVARRAESKGKTIVVILPDTGERYLSTELFATTDGK